MLLNVLIILVVRLYDSVVLYNILLMLHHSLIVLSHDLRYYLFGIGASVLVHILRELLKWPLIVRFPDLPLEERVVRVGRLQRKR